MYAVSFDLDTQVLQKTYDGPSWQNAYGKIKSFMDSNGFSWQQGSVYFGDDKMTSVKCVMVIQKLALEYEWFAPSVKDIRMLRIEELNDLAPAIDQIVTMKRGNSV